MTHYGHGTVMVGAATGLALAHLTNAAIDGFRQAAADRNDARALAAWGHELARARGDAHELGEIAKEAVTAMVDAQDEADALREEVAALRRAVEQRDAVIRGLAV